MVNPVLAVHGLSGDADVMNDVQTAAFNAFHKGFYPCDTSGGQLPVLFPANPKPGFRITIADYGLLADAIPIVINFNGRKFRNMLDNYEMDTKGAVRVFYYLNDQKGWFVK